MSVSELHCPARHQLGHVWLLMFKCGLKSRPGAAVATVPAWRAATWLGRAGTEFQNSPGGRGAHQSLRGEAGRRDAMRWRGALGHSPWEASRDPG